MAVENKYVNSDLASDKIGVAAFVNGAAVIGMTAIAEVAAADSDGSVYRLFKSLPGDLIPLKIYILNDAITAGTDYDLGFYEPSGFGVTGAVIDKDKLQDGMDLSTGHTEADALELGGAQYDISESQERLYELAGHTLTTRKTGYDIALTANTVGSAAGTVVVKALFLQG